MSDFECDICKKYYKNYKNLINHKKMIHNITTAADVLQCDICQKIISRKDNYKRHILTCQSKNKKYEELETKTDNLHKKLEEREQYFKTEIAELKDMVKELINTNCKMHYKTFEKMKNNITINNTNNGTINNGPVNNINIIALGKENLEEIFTENEKINILNKKHNALNYIIEYVHFNEKFPQFQNIIVTNNRENTAYIYDQHKKEFKLVSKDELIEELIEFRICDIEDFYMEHTNNIDDITKEVIIKLIDERGSDEITKNDVKLLLYNNRNKVKKLLS